MGAAEPKGMYRFSRPSVKGLDALMEHLVFGWTERGARPRGDDSSHAVKGLAPLQPSED